MRQTAIVAGLLAAAAVTGVHAENGKDAPPPETGAANATVVAVPETRTEPPHGLFKLFVGKEVKDAVQVGDVVKVLGVNKYYGFKGTHVWYQIEPPHEVEGIEGPVWVYVGIEEAEGPLTINLDIDNSFLVKG